MSSYKVAVIGGGIISQVMHLPYLSDHPEAEIHSLVEVSDERRNSLSEKYGINNSYDDYSVMLNENSEKIDCCFVLTPTQTHYDIISETLRNEIHTFVEKPLTISVEEAEKLVQIEDEVEAVGMMGYMKRYDEVYTEFKSETDELDDPSLVRAYDVDPDHLGIINERYDIIGGLPTTPRVEQKGRRQELEKAVNSEKDEIVSAYDFQLEHVCHDLNLLRDLFGSVKEIGETKLIQDNAFLVTNLTYEDDVTCQLTSGYSDRSWFEENMKVDTMKGIYEIDFTNPFIRNSETTYRKRVSEDMKEKSIESKSTSESFRTEINAFFNYCETGKNPVTDFEEAKDDVELLIRIFDELDK